MGPRSKRGRMWAWVYLNVFEDEKDTEDEE